MPRCVVILLVIHALLIAWIDRRNSPVSDEIAHLAAGLSIWNFGRFDLYSVNPPLVRSLAALPVLLSRPRTDWTLYTRRSSDERSRIEWSVGLAFLRANPGNAIWYFTLARWACMPFALLGAYFCWRWSDELYGRSAGIVSLLLWCFSPNILAWGSTLCADLPAASLGITANYYFWRWLRKPTTQRAFVAGICLGLLELTKLTWLLLYALWPLMWLTWLLCRGGHTERRSLPGQTIQLLSILLIGLSVLNIGYLCDGSFTRLGDLSFSSRLLAGSDLYSGGGDSGNRFCDSWLRWVPIPLPSDYLKGIDIQTRDFEQGLPSYLCGEWRSHGWWYFYLVCAGGGGLREVEERDPTTPKGPASGPWAAEVGSAP